MIKIISGTCRTSKGLKTSKDKPFDLPAAEEQRFIDRKVAVRVFAEPPVEEVATPHVAPDGAAAGVNSADTKNGAEGDDGGAANDAPVANIVDGHFVKEDLMKLTRDNLNALAADLGIDGESCANKGEVADLICAIEIGGDDDGGQMPSLTPGDPVV